MPAERRCVTTCAGWGLRVSAKGALEEEVARVGALPAGQRARPAGAGVRVCPDGHRTGRRWAAL